MKNQLVIVAILFLCAFQTFAQSSEQTIQIKKTAFGTSYLQNEKKLTPKQLLDITQYNAEANEIMKKAKTNADVSMVLGAIGGFMIGWPLGTAIAGGDPNWTLAGVGAGFVVVSIPFSVKYSKQAKEAVSIHNKTFEGVSRLNFDIGCFHSGLGLKISF